MKKLAITSGDPAGVGPEIIENILQQRPDLLESVAVIGEQQWVEKLQNQWGVHIAVAGELPTLKVGTPTIEGAALALQAMKIAAQGCIDGEYSAVVTGPISKLWCQKAGMKHPGQTEFFADAWDGVPTMAFVSPKFRVSLATWHIPLMQVKESLTESELLRCLNHTAELLLRLKIEKPRIAVCGLNPHAGEEGQIGSEEQEIYNPILERWGKEHSQIEISKCLPADTLFYRHLQGEFDAVVALYHDQALGPVKTVAFHEAVNTTLGLRYIRTSPDHGTAYEIAGKRLARSESFLNAMELALQLQ